MEILRLYFPLCYRPVLLFLSPFAFSPSFLLFHLHSPFVYKRQISVLKKGVFLGHGQQNFMGASSGRSAGNAKWKTTEIGNFYIKMLLAAKDQR